MDQPSFEVLSMLRTSGGKLPMAWLQCLTEEQRYALNQLRTDRLVIHTDGEMDGLGGMYNHQSIAITDAGKYSLASEECRRNDAADQAARKAEEKAADDAKAVIDKKQSFRHDFHVAAFSVALTLCLEHINDIVDLVKTVLKSIALLFH